MMPPGERLPKDLGRIGEIDGNLHAPARLKILAVLHVVERADFTYVLQQTRLTRGNLATHLSRLEDGGYIKVKKMFVARKPRTLIWLSNKGRDAIQAYRQTMREVIDGLFG
jgi:DNA-binding MarR family transcriptional regulator